LTAFDAYQTEEEEEEDHSQLPMTSGQLCQSMGKSFSIIGHFALIVNLNSEELVFLVREFVLVYYLMEYVMSPCSDMRSSLLGLVMVWR